jgi:ferrous iron transport protein A
VFRRPADDTGQACAYNECEWFFFRIPSMFGQALTRLGVPGLVDAAPALRERDADAPSVPEVRAGASAGPQARRRVPLTALARDAAGVVAGVRLPEAAELAQDPALARMALRLMEIGFIEGARLRVVAFGQPGDDPIGVRVGGRGGMTTFALRRVEAACVWVWPDR